MLLLRGGELCDGTGSPRRRADVLLGTSGRIEQVGPDLATRGAEILDVGGLVVTPGFIDTHAHTDLALFASPDLPMKLRQGVTLDIVGQDGLSVVPVEPGRASALQEEQRWLCGDAGPVRGRLSTVAEYLGELDERRAGIGAGYLCPHGALRTLVMGPGQEQRAPSEAELVRMCAALEAALAAGALGLSTGLIYPPCLWADADELTALCRVVARAGGVFAVHLRNESGRVLEAVDEMVAVARGSNVHLHVSHLKILGRVNWGLIDALIGRLEEARARGVSLTADQYPYTASFDDARADPA
jgi:N-acyl-D-amino-acid deacylase